MHYCLRLVNVWRTATSCRNLSFSSHQAREAARMSSSAGSSSYEPYPAPDEETAVDIKKRIESVRRTVASAAEKSKGNKRVAAQPRLVAISKLHPPSSIMAAYVLAGQRHFGENYVQEMADKARVLPKGEDGIRWHFVGGLQSNKGKLLAAIPNLYLLETLDSVKAANVLEKALASDSAAPRDNVLRVYLQVNTSGEETKSGLSPLTEEGHSSGPLLELARHVITSCPHLHLCGLMTIGAAGDSCAANQHGDEIDDVLNANPDFGRLVTTRTLMVRALRMEADAIKQKFPTDATQGSPAPTISKDAYKVLLDPSGPESGDLELSMGMSADVEVAIMAGSDNVRVGTDCFGTRPGTREEAMTKMKGELESNVGEGQ